MSLLKQIVSCKHGRGRGGNDLVIVCLVRNNVSILIQDTNLAPCNALWRVLRQCINLVNIEPEARPELIALSLLSVNRARHALVAEDDIAFTVNEATEVILLTRELSCKRNGN